MTTGWPSVCATCLRLGITFDPWQDGAGRVILAKRKDGTYAADAVVISIPRQVGKTFLIGSIVFALAIIHPGLTVIWTAHRFKTARETFDAMRALAARKQMQPHVEKIATAAGNESILFRNGSRILFGARERGFGRGFTKVDVLIFDEAQILTQNAMDDMVPATNQSPNPLVILTGTPPKPSDPGEVFTALREEALNGDATDVLYIEFSADPDGDPMDREQWKKANPSHPHRTPVRAMLRMLKLLGLASFIREGLGIWDGTSVIGAFGSGAWARCKTAEPPGDPAGLGISADIDQVWLSLAAASGDEPRHLGSVLHVRVDEQQTEFVAEVKRIQDEHGIPVAIDAKGPASFLIPDLDEAGVTVTRASLDDIVQAHADIRVAVQTRTVVHGGYDDLNEAVDAAGWRKVGKRRVFAARSAEISSLEAAALAAWSANKASVEENVW